MNCDGYGKDKSKYSIKHQANFSSIVFVASQKKTKINDHSKTKSRLMRTRGKRDRDSEKSQKSKTT